LGLRIAFFFYFMAAAFGSQHRLFSGWDGSSWGDDDATKEENTGVLTIGESLEFDAELRFA
jgi:hypothetical protein